jgi:hypothetical protein
MDQKRSTEGSSESSEQKKVRRKNKIHLFLSMSGQRTPDDSSDRVPQCVVVRRDKRRLQKQAERRSKKRDEIKKEIGGYLITEFEVRSFVLVEHVQNKLRRGPDSKLLPFLEGTVNVVQRKNGTHEEILSSRGRRIIMSRYNVFMIQAPSKGSIQRKKFFEVFGALDWLSRTNVNHGAMRNTFALDNSFHLHRLIPGNVKSADSDE